MTFTKEVCPEYTKIVITDDKLNYENANNFSNKVVRIIERDQPQVLAIDFINVVYLSSIGISALSIIKGIGKINKTNLVLFSLNEMVIDTLKQTGVDTMFRIFNNERELKKYLGEH